MELAAAGEDLKKLREIARVHIARCEAGDMQPITKVVNEIVHVYETREQIEFNDQTPLLEINPSKNGGNTH